MSTLRCFLLALLCSCAVVPTTRATSRDVGFRDGPLIGGVERAIVLAPQMHDGTLTVHASRVRDCQRQILAVTEITRSRELTISSPDDPRAKVFGLVLAPVVLPVSALVSGIAVAASNDETTEQTRIDHTIALRCEGAAPGLVLEVVAPSGALLHATANDVGDAQLDVPAGEPYRGTLVIRAAGGATAQIAYDRPLPPVAALRDAARTCAIDQDITGTLRVELTVDETGAPRHIHVDRGTTPLAACIGASVKHLRFAKLSTTLVFAVDLPSALAEPRS